VKGPPAWELVSSSRGSWKEAVVQRGLEHGSRGIATVSSRYQETFSEATAGWKNLACALVNYKL
jgi:hypothetical protein